MVNGQSIQVKEPLKIKETYLISVWRHNSFVPEEIEIPLKVHFDMLRDLDEEDSLVELKRFLLNHYQEGVSVKNKPHIFEQLCLSRVEFIIRRDLDIDMTFEDGSSWKPLKQKDFNQKGSISFDRTEFCPEPFDKDEFACFSSKNSGVHSLLDED